MDASSQYRRRAANSTHPEEGRCVRTLSSCMLESIIKTYMILMSDHHELKVADLLVLVRW